MISDGLFELLLVN